MKVLHIFAFEKQNKFRNQEEEFISRIDALCKDSIFISYHKEGMLSVFFAILKAIIFNYRIVLHGLDKITLLIFFFLFHNKIWFKPWGGEIEWLAGGDFKGIIKRFLVLKVFYWSDIVSTDCGDKVFRDYNINIDRVNLVAGAIVSNHIQNTYHRVVDEGSIMIGHSTNKCNRHLDIINSYNFTGKELFIPFTYSKDYDYIKEVKDLLQKNGYSHRILTKTISQEEYYHCLNNSVSTAIIPSANCGMAYSNIIHLLSMGKTVVLPTENELYGYLSEIGCFILPLSKYNLGNRLTEKQIESNISTISSAFSLNKLRRNYLKWYGVRLS